MKLFTRQRAIIIGVTFVIALTVWSNNSSRVYNSSENLELEQAFLRAFSSLYMNALESTESREYEGLIKAFQKYFLYYLDLNTKNEGRLKIKEELVKLQCLWERTVFSENNEENLDLCSEEGFFEIELIHTRKFDFDYSTQTIASAMSAALYSHLQVTDREPNNRTKLEKLISQHGLLTLVLMHYAYELHLLWPEISKNSLDVSSDFSLETLEDFSKYYESLWQSPDRQVYLKAKADLLALVDSLMASLGKLKANENISLTAEVGKVEATLVRAKPMIEMLP